MAISISNVKNIAGSALETIRANPITTVGAVTGTTALVGGGLVLANVKRRKTRTTRKRKARTRRGRSRDRKFISKQKHEKAYVRRKKKAGKKITRKRYKTKSPTSRKGKKVYYARKTGQPYIKLASGKAKFIKGKRRKR